MGNKHSKSNKKAKTQPHDTADIGTTQAKPIQQTSPKQIHQSDIQHAQQHQMQMPQYQMQPMPYQLPQPFQREEMTQTLPNWSRITNVNQPKIYLNRIPYLMQFAPRMIMNEEQVNYAEYMDTQYTTIDDSSNEKISQSNVYTKTLNQSRRENRAHRTTVYYPVINEYTTHNADDTVTYFKLEKYAKPKEDRTLDAFKSVDEYKSVPSGMTNIAIVGTISGEIGQILNRKILHLEQNVKDYRYPAQLDQAVANITQFRQEFAQREYNETLAVYPRGVYEVPSINMNRETIESVLDEACENEMTLDQWDLFCWKFHVQVHKSENKQIFQLIDANNNGAFDKKQFSDFCERKYKKDSNNYKMQQLLLFAINEYVHPDTKENEILDYVFMDIEDDVKFKQYGVRIHDLIDPSMNCTFPEENDYKPLWIPTLFNVSDEGDVVITSEINNLPKVQYLGLYCIFECIFKCMIPSFEWIVGDSLSNKDLKVIVKMQNYELLPKQRYRAKSHREGTRKQNIIAVGIYYFNKSVVFETDRLQIAAMDGKVSTMLNIEEGKFIVFNNRDGMSHRLDCIENGSENEIGVRKILTFFVVDPRLKNDYHTSKDILVNRSEYVSMFVLMNWFRKIFGENNQSLSNDLIALIVLFVYNMDILMKRKRRTYDKIKCTADSKETEFHRIERQSQISQFTGIMRFD